MSSLCYRCGVVKSAPFSLRLSAETDEWIAAEAERTKRSKGSVVASLAEEALRARMFPGIAFRGRDWDRRPWVIGTALDVWQIVRAWQDFESVAAMVEAGDLTQRQIDLALAYYRRFPQEVDRAIAEDRRTLAQLQAEHPTVAAVRYP